MLRLTITYTSSDGRQRPILTSLHRGIMAITAERILTDYDQGAERCPDPVLAALIRTEAHQARQLLAAAGLPVAQEARHV